MSNKILLKVFNNINELNNFHFNLKKNYNVILNLIDNKPKNYFSITKNINISFYGKLTINIYYYNDLHRLSGNIDIDELIINNYLNKNIKLDFNTSIKKLIYNHKLERFKLPKNNKNSSQDIILDNLNKKSTSKVLYLKGNYLNLKELYISNVKYLNLYFANYNNFKITSDNLNDNININKDLKIKKIDLKNNQIYTFDIINENKNIDIKNNTTLKCNNNINLNLNIINNNSNVKINGKVNNIILNNSINNLFVSSYKINNIIGKINNLTIYGNDINSLLGNINNLKLSCKNIKKIITEINNNCNIYSYEIDYINGKFKNKTLIDSTKINNLYGDFNNLTIENCKNLNLENINNVNYLTLINCNIKKIPSNLYNIKQLNIENCNITEISDCLINLKELNLNKCKKIISIPNNYINLNYLKINKCKKIKEIDNKLKNLDNIIIQFKK